MPEKKDVEQDGKEERQEGNNPDEQGEQHGEVDDCLLFVSLLHHGFDVEEELRDGGFALGCSVFSLGYDLGFHDSPKS